MSKFKPSTQDGGGIFPLHGSNNESRYAPSGYVPKSRKINTSSGIKGGGDLSEDLHLYLEFGNTEGTAVEGNDERLSNARDWVAQLVSNAVAADGESEEAFKWSPKLIRVAIEGWWESEGFSEKIEGIETGATKNKSDSYLLNRRNHTGTQPISSIEGLEDALRGGGFLPPISNGMGVKNINMRDTAVYTLLPSDIGRVLVFDSHISDLQIKMPLTYGNVGDELYLVAPFTYQNDSELVKFYTDLFGTLIPPQMVIGAEARFSRGRAVVKLKKISSLYEGMGNWLLSGELDGITGSGGGGLGGGIEEAPNNGDRYIRQNRQWAVLANELEYYDINYYEPSPDLEAGSLVFYRGFPRIPLSGPDISTCVIGIASPVGVNVTFRLKNVTDTWEATATIIAGQIQAGFTSSNSGPLEMGDGLIMEIIAPALGSMPALKGLWFTLRFQVRTDIPANFLRVPQALPEESLILFGSSSEGNVPTAVLRNLHGKYNLLTQLRGEHVEHRNQTVTRRDGKTFLAATTENRIVEISTNTTETVREFREASPYRRFGLTMDRTSTEVFWIEERETFFIVRANYLSGEILGEHDLGEEITKVNNLTISANGRQALVSANRLLIIRILDWLEEFIYDPPVGEIKDADVTSEGAGLITATATQVYMHRVNNGVIVDYFGDVTWTAIEGVHSDVNYQNDTPYARFYVYGQDEDGYKIVPYSADDFGYFDLGWDIRVSGPILDIALAKPNPLTLSYADSDYGRALAILCEDKYIIFNLDTKEIIEEFEFQYFVQNSAISWVNRVGELPQ